LLLLLLQLLHTKRRRSSDGNRHQNFPNSQTILSTDISKILPQYRLKKNIARRLPEELREFSCAKREDKGMEQKNKKRREI
jgi:hypothetical protein